MVTWSIPVEQQTVTGHFDGSDMPVVGPNALPGTTLATQNTARRKFDYVVKEKGSVVQYGRMTLSDDGNAITEEAWRPGEEGQKASTVLVRYRCPETDGGRPTARDQSDHDWICGH